MKRTKTQKKQNLLLVVSLVAVGLLVAASFALMMASDDSIAVNTRNIDSQNSFTLEEGNTGMGDDLLKPVSMLDDQLGLDAIEEMDYDKLFAQTTEEVPEPATMSLLALGGAAMLRRRRRNRK